MSNLKIYPFGGVGEIGSNMTIFETENHLVIIDYGILFPYEDFFDINYLIADSSQLPTDKEKTLFITHGHEDHIGAISHILTEHPDITVHAPRLARELILKKLERRKLSRTINLYQEDFEFKFDEYTLHPIHVTHSIPDTYGLIFKSPELATLFISDFKFDLNPSFERPFNTAKIKELFSSSKVKLAMLDSTNILSEGKTLSESELIPDLEKIINSPKRTFITLFSSNLYRVKNILEIAKRSKKKVTTIGRSIRSYLEAANACELFSLDDYPLIEFDGIQNYSDPNIIYLVTGSQGEFLGAARRIISGEQKHIQLCNSDQFVFSSKPIPGNESKIYRLYNQLSEQDVEIINFRTHKIHASGHPCQEDLRALMEEIKPDFYIPIHGETYFLKKHIEFVNKVLPDTKTIYLQNFSGIEFKNSNPKIFKFDEIPPHIIHGNDIILEREKISERRKMACNGVVFISLNSKTKNINIETKGLPNFTNEERPKLLDLVDYTAFAENKNRDYDYTTEQIRIKTRTFFQSLLGYKPITIVQMV